MATFRYPKEIALEQIAQNLGLRLQGDMLYFAKGSTFIDRASRQECVFTIPNGEKFRELLKKARALCCLAECKRIL